MMKLRFSAILFAGLAACGTDDGTGSGTDRDGSGTTTITDKCSEEAVCTLNSGDTITEYINEDEDTDVYTFSATAGSVIQVHVENEAQYSPVVLRARLFNPDGTVLKSGSGSQGKQSISLQAEAPTSGSYRVIVDEVGNDAHDNNPYKITVTTLAQTDENEPNNTAAEASAITPGATLINGAIGSQGDVDVYKFSASANQLVQIAITPVAGSSVRLKWRLFNNAEFENPIAESTQPSSGDWAAESRAVGETAGTFYLVVEATESTAADLAHGYGLTIQTVGEPDSHDRGTRNDTSAAASSISGSATGFIASTSDEDYYSFSATEHQLIIVEATMPASSIGLSFTVLGPDGETQICDTVDGDLCKAFRYSSDGSEAVTLRTAHFAPTSGTYYVVVRDYQDNEFDLGVAYTLNVTVRSDPDTNEKFVHDREHATQVTQSASTTITYPAIEGYISYANDEDWYEIALPYQSPYNGDWEMSLHIEIAASPVELQVFGNWRCNGSLRGYGKQTKEEEDVVQGEDPNQYTEAQNAMDITIGKNGDSGSDGCLVMFRECTNPANTNGGSLYLRMSDLARDDFSVTVPYRVTVTAYAGCAADGACSGRYTNAGSDMCGRP